MLKFRPEHQAMIVGGAKRETRRMWKVPQVHVGEVHEAWAYEPGTTRTCMFCWGQRSDQPRTDVACSWCGGTGEMSERPFAKLLVTEVFTQKVCDFTDKDAKAEGYRKSDELWEALLRVYGRLELQAEMVVVRFDVVEVLSHGEASETGTTKG